MSDRPFPQAGDQAPDFTLPASDGSEVGLSQFRGAKAVVLYFYPKDDTPGCTKEACNFRDAISDIEALDAMVLGVSPDGLDSHNRFIDKFNLPFLLLSDESHEVAEGYGAWKKMNMFGMKFWGVARSTFIIGRDGKVVKAFRRVKVDTHHQEVLEVLRSLQ